MKSNSSKLANQMNTIQIASDGTIKYEKPSTETKDMEHAEEKATVTVWGFSAKKINYDDVEEEAEAEEKSKDENVSWLEEVSSSESGEENDTDGDTEDDETNENIDRRKDPLANSIENDVQPFEDNTKNARRNEKENLDIF